jgi:twitching motility protein PilI
VAPQISAQELAALPPFDQLLEIERQCLGHDATAPGVAGSAAWTGLAFRLAETQMVVALEQVAEIMAVPKLVDVPGTRPWVRGIANLRGTVMTVVDLPAFLGIRQRTDSPRNRLLVVGSLR